MWPITILVVTAHCLAPSPVSHCEPPDEEPPGGGHVAVLLSSPISLPVPALGTALEGALRSLESPKRRWPLRKLGNKFRFHQASKLEVSKVADVALCSQRSRLR